MPRTILNESSLFITFWSNSMNIACYVMNRALIRTILIKTPFKLYYERKPNISHFHIFNCICFVHNNGKDNLDTFNCKFKEAFIINYSSFRKALHV